MCRSLEIAAIPETGIEANPELKGSLLEIERKAILNMCIEYVGVCN